MVQISKAYYGAELEQCHRALQAAVPFPRLCPNSNELILQISIVKQCLPKLKFCTAVRCVRCVYFWVISVAVECEARFDYRRLLAARRFALAAHGVVLAARWCELAACGRVLAASRHAFRLCANYETPMSCRICKSPKRITWPNWNNAVVHCRPLCRSQGCAQTPVSLFGKFL